MCLGRARQRSGCVHCCITHATQCGLTGEHAVFTHTGIVSIRYRSVPAIHRLRACVNVRPRYSRNTFAVFQVPRTSQLVSRTEVQASYTSRRVPRRQIPVPRSHGAVNSSYENRAAADARSRRIDPVRRMTMAGHRAPAVAGRPGERALAKPPRRKCNPIRGDRNSAYGDSAVALPPRMSKAALPGRDAAVGAGIAAALQHAVGVAQDRTRVADDFVVVR